jgi:3-deoxy-D-manno-octulosonate 8-phosphate phosphatase (KDO 8-P phosphatase)
VALSDIKLVVMDVDGVLTDGTISVDEAGRETKHFNVRDWTGIAYLERAGIRTAILSGRTSAAVTHRAREVGMSEVHQGAKEKLPVLREMLKRLGLKPGEVAYIGDDLMDIPVAREVGFAVAVADAHEELKSRCHHVTAAAGGKGAVRELAEHLLKAQDKWATIMKRYVGDSP